METFTRQIDRRLNERREREDMLTSLRDRRYRKREGRGSTFASLRD